MSIGAAGNAPRRRGECASVLCELQHKALAEGRSSHRNHRPIGAKSAAGSPSRIVGCVEGELVPSNNVQRYRESMMMSKAELARKAGLSTLTIDRIEAGRPCRLDTKRKILQALGLKVVD